tara:strand:+ start:75 stop:932 length:858 start_codon:yes stop_codon:yes gene_type:complete
MILNIGLICHGDQKKVGHINFDNYRKALKNYFKGSNFTDITNEDQLSEINLLIIVDEHFGPHVDIWKRDSFIEKLNNLNLKVLLFNIEKIYSSQFPWNVDHQNKVETINNLIQLFGDIEDRKIKNAILNKHGLLSKSQKLKVRNKEKKDSIVFLGQAEGPQYHRRQQILNYISSRSTKVPLEIKVTNRKLTYQEYIETLAEYKYVLNPLGCGDFINLRFYEALELGCIPIQQVTPEMLDLYSRELEYSINFIQPEDINLKKEFKKMNYYLEDYFEELNLKSILNS